MFFVCPAPPCNIFHPRYWILQPPLDLCLPVAKIGVVRAILRVRNNIATAIGSVSSPSRRMLSPPKRLARNFVLGLPRHEIQTKWWQVTANDIQEALQNRIRARIKDSGEIDQVGYIFLLHASLHTQTANTTTDTNTRITHTHTLYQITRKLLQMMILDFDTLKLVSAWDLANEPNAKMTEFQVMVFPSLPPSTPSLPPSLPPHTHASA